MIFGALLGQLSRKCNLFIFATHMCCIASPVSWHERRPSRLTTVRLQVCVAQAWYCRHCLYVWRKIVISKAMMQNKIWFKTIINHWLFVLTKSTLVKLNAWTSKRFLAISFHYWLIICFNIGRWTHGPNFPFSICYCIFLRSIRL